MIKVDLITGFLGSGKTTFILKYAKYLMAKGEKIGIIENDFGAINVDMMLLADLAGDNCELEMVTGGSDYETHQRRFKTKLINMAMCGYNHIIVEPSGIYDVDEFFDVLHEEPLTNWYEIGSVITIVDAKLENNLSRHSNYLLASQIADAGKIILSRVQEATESEISDTINHLNQVMEEFKCSRRFGDDVFIKDWDLITDKDFNDIEKSGYQLNGHIKLMIQRKNDFSTLFYMNMKIGEEELKDKIYRMMNDEKCGHIFRIKGFILKENNQWLEFNVTHENMNFSVIEKGQEVIIVIGENLNKEIIDSYWS